MSLSALSGVLAGVVFAISAGWYTVDVAKRKIVPSIATFVMFTVINVSQLISLTAEHVWHVLPFTIVGALSSALVCLFAIKSRRLYFELPDKIGIAGALVGAVVWITTDSATANLAILSIVNLAVFVPLIVKSFKRPDLETTLPWRLNFLASLFLLLTINSASPSVWLVPARQFLCSLLLNVGLTSQRWRQVLRSARDRSAQT